MDAIDFARLSLDGLSVGDAFGELFFGEYGRAFFRRTPCDTSGADLPPGPWPWTDDTHMALSVVGVSLLVLFMLGWRESAVVAVAIPSTLSLLLLVFHLVGRDSNGSRSAGARHRSLRAPPGSVVASPGKTRR